MSDKDALEKKIQAKLDEADAEIHKLQARAREQDADKALRQQIEERRAELEKHQAALKSKLDALRSKSESSWKEIEHGAQQAWDDLSSALKRAAEHFKS